MSEISGGGLPLSPAVDLAGASLVQVEVRLDVYVTPSNSAAAVSGAPDTAALGVRVLNTAPAVVPAGSEWDMDPLTPTADFLPVTAQLPAGAAGDRQWLRLKAVTYKWTAAGGINGSTTCRLVGEIPLVGGTSTVETPVYGFLSPLAGQYPESATYIAAGSATFATFADRVTVTGTVAPPPSSSCTVTDPSGCTTGQQITATVTAGTLSQQADAAGSNPSSTAIVLTEQDAGDKYTYAGTPAVTTATAAQVMEGALNPVTVTDVRGGTAGWSLTAELSGPFTEVGTGEMPESAAALVQVGCAPLAGSATRTTGTGGNLTNAVTLCGVDPGVGDSDGQSGGGQYEVTGAVELTVPAFQKAGEYSATLVITLT